MFSGDRKSAKGFGDLFAALSSASGDERIETRLDFDRVIQRSGDKLDLHAPKPVQQRMNTIIVLAKTADDDLQLIALSESDRQIVRKAFADLAILCRKELR